MGENMISVPLELFTRLVQSEERLLMIERLLNYEVDPDSNLMRALLEIDLISNKEAGLSFKGLFEDMFGE